MCRIRSEPNEDNVEQEYFFEYRVKATFIHIRFVVIFEHTLGVQTLTRLCLTKQINKKLLDSSNLSYR